MSSNVKLTEKQEQKPHLETTTNTTSSEGNSKKLPYFYKMHKILHNKLYKKYTTGKFSYSHICTNWLIYNEKSRIVCRFTEFLTFYDNIEYVKRFYYIKESKPRLKKILLFYEKYSKIFPNYLVIEENKYLYRNIRRKQKMIDAINAIKNEEGENRKHIKNSENKSKNIFFTKPIKEEIRRYLQKASSDKKKYLDNSNDNNTILLNYNINKSERSVLLNSFLNNETNGSITDIMSVLVDDKNLLNSKKNNNTKKLTAKAKKITKIEIINSNKKNNINRNLIKNSTAKKGRALSPKEKSYKQKLINKNTLLSSHTKTYSTSVISTKQIKSTIILPTTASLSKKNLFESYKENLATEKINTNNNYNNTEIKTKLKKNLFTEQSKISTINKKKKNIFCSQDFTNFTRKIEYSVKTLYNKKSDENNALFKNTRKTKTSTDLNSKTKDDPKIFLTAQKNNKINTIIEEGNNNNNILIKQKTEYKIRKMQVKKLNPKNTESNYKKIKKENVLIEKKDISKNNILYNSTNNFSKNGKITKTIDEYTTNIHSSKKRDSKILKTKNNLLSGKTHNKLNRKIYSSPFNKKTQTNSKTNIISDSTYTKKTQYKSYLRKKKNSCDLNNDTNKNISQKIIDKMIKSKEMILSGKIKVNKKEISSSSSIFENLSLHKRTITENNKLSTVCKSLKNQDNQKKKIKIKKTASIKNLEINDDYKGNKKEQEKKNVKTEVKKKKMDVNMKEKENEK